MRFPDALRRRYAPASANVCAATSAPSLVGMVPSDIPQSVCDVCTASRMTCVDFLLTLYGFHAVFLDNLTL